MVTIHFIKLSFAVLNRNQLFFSGAFRVRMSPFFCAEAIFASGVGDIGTYILMKLCIDGFQGFFLWLPEEVLALLFSSLS